MADLALSVELADRGERPGRDLKRREGREDRDIGQVLRRNGAELLRMTKEVDRPVQRFNRLDPPLRELGDVRNQNFLAERAIRLAHLLLLAW